MFLYKILKKRGLFLEKKTITHHTFAGLLICENCGRNYKFKTTKNIAKYECTTYNDLGKNYCSSKAIPESTLINDTCELLNMDEFNEETLRSKVDRIIVKDNNLLEFHCLNGTMHEVKW